MIKQYHIENHQLIPDTGTNSTICVYINPDQTEKEYLVHTLCIDEHTLASALDPDELARLEFEADHVALIIKRPKNYSFEDNFLFKVASLGMFLFKERLVVVVSEDIPLFDGKQFLRISSLRDIILRLMYRCVFHYLEHLKVINQISDEIEQKVNQSMENRHLLNMFSLEKSLVYYLNSINSNAAVIERLKMNSAKVEFTPDNIEFLDDLMIENQQCFKQAEIYSNIISSLMDARAGIVNNNLNVLIKRLTVINIVFMPLNLIAGIGGMSEYSMMTRHIPWPVAYGTFSLGMIFLGLLTYAIINRIGSQKKSRRLGRFRKGA